MVVDVMISMPAKINVAPGDKIEMIGRNGVFKKVNAVIENRDRVYIVTTSGTWHPVSAYGKTWRLVK